MSRVSPEPHDQESKQLKPHSPKKLRSSSAILEEKLNPPLKIALISWNMANGNGSNEDLEGIIETIKMQNGEDIPDIIVVATQEEGRNVGKEYLCDQINAEFDGLYNKTAHSFTTMTKPGAFGRVSLTVLSQPKFGKAELTWREVQVLNKGGIGCEISINGHHFSFSGMHLDSKQDNLKVKTVVAMIAELEGEKNSNNYINYHSMEKSSTELDIIMGDLNHRYVRADNETLYDPSGNSDHGNPDYMTSAARYIDALGFTPARDENETEGLQAANTYHKDQTNEYVASKKVRVEGATKSPCLQMGTLDRILISGSANITPVSVVESKASDHLPIICTITTSRVPTDFQRTRDWVIRKIENYASEKVLKILKSLEDNPNDKLHLEIVFNYYKYVRDLTLQAEEFRLRKERGGMQYAVLMGGTGSESELNYRETIHQSLANSYSELEEFKNDAENKQGLVQQMIENGNNVFQNKQYLINSDKLIDLALVKPKADKENRSFLDESYKKADKVIIEIGKAIQKAQLLEPNKIETQNKKWFADDIKPPTTNLRSSRQY